MGPVTAAADLITRVVPLAPKRVLAERFGSAAPTGKRHAADSAIIPGLCGEHPEALATAPIGPRAPK